MGILSEYTQVCVYADVITMIDTSEVVMRGIITEYVPGVFG